MAAGDAVLGMGRREGEIKRGSRRRRRRRMNGDGGRGNKKRPYACKLVAREGIGCEVGVNDVWRCTSERGARGRVYGCSGVVCGSLVVVGGAPAPWMAKGVW
jgi:hypothetical protein